MNTYKRFYLHSASIFIFFIVSLLRLQAQSVYGTITQQDGKALPFANVYVLGENIGVSANENGQFDISINKTGQFQIVFSVLGFLNDTVAVRISQNQRLALNPMLQNTLKEIDEVKVVSIDSRRTMMVRLNTQDISKMPSVSGGVEAVLKTLPGVKSNNELSSQYSVRGGNFDENLVYVNDVEIYRPILIRAGQQEGLSFVNPALVSSLAFSSGGFESFYGDKMSSVLDIKYKRPTENGGSVALSLLGASAHVEGVSTNRKFTYLAGYRYQSNRLLLSSLPTEGEYNPTFNDFQTYLTYEVNPRFEISFLGNVTQNKYLFIPNSLESGFGTIDNMMSLKIYYDGSELDKFLTGMGAFTFNYHPNNDFNIKYITSSYVTSEQETFDIEGQYLINEVDDVYNSENQSDSASNIGIGSFLNHARNFLNAYVYSNNIKGYFAKDIHTFRWGVGHNFEIIQDQMNEWVMMDSAGYSIPYSDSEINISDVRKADYTIYNHRINGYFNYALPFFIGLRELNLSVGVRGNYRSLSREVNVSPRGMLTFDPKWRKDIIFKMSSGYYYQPPFYKEMRMPDGKLNTNIKSQKSIHYVLGSEYCFKAWNRPFKLTAETYYKLLQNLIPYKVDNVRIIYAGDNLATGYATGFDLKVNGEFIKGTDSWMSVSLMSTQEDIENDSYTLKDGTVVTPGYYPRQTDQFINFGMFFQDYLPGNPSYKMQLSLLYGSRLPYSPPDTERYDMVLRMPPYRRVDLGFYKVFKSYEFKPKNSNSLRWFKELSAGIEIFNLFDISNTISYLWIQTISSNPEYPNRFAVPNYLTGRRLNVKITASF